MVLGRPQRAGLLLAAFGAALLLWAAPPPAAHASPKCGKACQAHREKLAQLRRQNALQKRPNVIVIDTDDMNASGRDRDCVEQAVESPFAVKADSLGDWSEMFGEIEINVERGEDGAK